MADSYARQGVKGLSNQVTKMSDTTSLTTTTKLPLWDLLFRTSDKHPIRTRIKNCGNFGWVNLRQTWSDQHSKDCSNLLDKFMTVNKNSRHINLLIVQVTKLFITDFYIDVRLQMP